MSAAKLLPVTIVAPQPAPAVSPMAVEIELRGALVRVRDGVTPGRCAQC